MPKKSTNQPADPNLFVSLETVERVTGHKSNVSLALDAAFCVLNRAEQSAANHPDVLHDLRTLRYAMQQAGAELDQVVEWAALLAQPLPIKKFIYAPEANA